MKSHPSLNYPSPSEVKIYIGSNMWIDDAYRIDYTLQNPRTPLYDYTSQYYKDVAEGHSIVQGQLIINFRFPGYLKFAMDQVLERQPDVYRTLDRSAEVFRDLAEGSAEDRVKKLLAYKKQGAMSYAKQVNKILYSDGVDKTKQSDIGASTTHLRRQFSIQINYGGDEALYVKTIEDCYIIGESQVISASAMAGGDLSASGMPIYEVYSFLGKKITDRITNRGASLSNLGSLNRGSKIPASPSGFKINRSGVSVSPGQLSGLPSLDLDSY